MGIGRNKPLHVSCSYRLPSRQNRVKVHRVPKHAHKISKTCATDAFCRDDWLDWSACFASVPDLGELIDLVSDASGQISRLQPLGAAAINGAHEVSGNFP
jgi:hypothetical protein